MSSYHYRHATEEVPRSVPRLFNVDDNPRTAKWLIHPDLTPQPPPAYISLPSSVSTARVRERARPGIAPSGLESDPELYYELSGSLPTHTPSGRSLPTQLLSPRSSASLSLSRGRRLSRTTVADPQTPPRRCSPSTAPPPPRASVSTKLQGAPKAPAASGALLNSKVSILDKNWPSNAEDEDSDATIRPPTRQARKAARSSEATQKVVHWRQSMEGQPLPRPHQKARSDPGARKRPPPVQQQRPSTKRAQSTPTLRTGWRGTARGFRDLRRKKPHLTEDTIDRVELLSRADQFFNTGMVSRYGRLNKEKTCLFRKEMDRVSASLQSIDI